MNPSKLVGCQGTPGTFVKKMEAALNMKIIKMKIVMKKRGKKVPLSKKDEF